MSYYATCAIPKPGTRKKNKKCNGWKDKPNRYCAYTGQPYAERHEVFGGANRQTSIDLGFQVDVSPEVHRELHENCSDWAKAENKRLRQKFQSQYEQELIEAGMEPEQARYAWIQLIGRSYLDDMPTM